MSEPRSKLRWIVALPLLLLAEVGWASPPVTPALCEVPVLWRVAELDDRFGLAAEEATDAVRRAGLLWAEAIGDRLLFQESGDGIPIRFVYDERQEQARQRQEREAALDRDARAIEEAEAELEGLRAELARSRTALDLRTRNYTERMENHTRAIAMWNRQGGAPPQEFERLREAEAALDAERRAINEAGEALNETVARVNDETDRMNRAIAELNEARTRFASEFPVVSFQSSEYREVRRGFGPFSTSVTREIAIYHFADRDHLVLLLARELGHALGLPASDVPGSVMSRDAQPPLTGNLPALHDSDRERIREHCPQI